MCTNRRWSRHWLPNLSCLVLALCLESAGCAASSTGNADARGPGDAQPDPDVSGADCRPSDIASDLSKGDLHDVPDGDLAEKPDLGLLDTSDLAELGDWLDGQCPADAPFPHNGECVQCIKLSDCPLADHLCMDHACIPMESAPEECRYCAYDSMLCGIPADGEGFFCTECLDDFDCDEGFGCSEFDRRCCPLLGGRTQCIWDPPPVTYCQSNDDCDWSLAGSAICDTTQPMGLCVFPDGTCDHDVGHCFGQETCMTADLLVFCVDPNFPPSPIPMKGGLCPCQEALADATVLKECLSAGAQSPTCLSSECYYGICVSRALLHFLEEPEAQCGAWQKPGLCVPPSQVLELLEWLDSLEAE